MIRIRSRGFGLCRAALGAPLRGAPFGGFRVIPLLRPLALKRFDVTLKPPLNTDAVTRLQKVAVFDRRVLLIIAGSHIISAKNRSKMQQNRRISDVLRAE